MHSNQSWPPVITALGVYPCFRNATRAEQGCCRDLQGHTVFLFKNCWTLRWVQPRTDTLLATYDFPSRTFPTLFLYFISVLAALIYARPRQLLP
jgi:hypothetical protein